VIYTLIKNWNIIKKSMKNTFKRFNFVKQIFNLKLIFKFLVRKQMLAKFLECDEDEIKNYLKEADEITRIMLKMIKIKNNFDTIQSTMLSPLRGPVLYVCIRALKPRIMVETGVSSGSSTHYILKAMELNGQGKLYSIDLPNIGLSVLPKGEKIGWLVPEQLKSRWTLILGRSQEKLLPLLYQLKTIDAFLHDSEHTYETMMFEYQAVWPFLKEGGILLSDDVHRNKAFKDFISNRCLKRWIIFDGLGAVIR